MKDISSSTREYISSTKLSFSRWMRELFRPIRNELFVQHLHWFTTVLAKLARSSTPANRTFGELTPVNFSWREQVVYILLLSYQNDVQAESSVSSYADECYISSLILLFYFGG